MSGSPGKLNAHAKLTLIQRVVGDGMTVAQVAYQLNISRTTAHRWLRHYRLEGIDGLRERSRRPHRSPRALSERLVSRIIALRQRTGRGPLHIAARVGVSCSTVHRVLERVGLNQLRNLDKVTRAVVRYERARPGELLHMDVKKLWKIPPGGGRRFELTYEGGESIPRAGKRGWGYEYLHVAIDDHSRYLYAEILPDYKARTTGAFLGRTVQHFRERGVRIERILTDNGANYRSRWFTHMARLRQIRLKRTRVYRPQTNGKAERVIQTLLREWAYQRRYRSNDQRILRLGRYLEEYNLHRPHTALGGRPPVSRL